MSTRFARQAPMPAGDVSAIAMPLGKPPPEPQTIRTHMVVSRNSNFVGKM